MPRPLLSFDAGLGRNFREDMNVRDAMATPPWLHNQIPAAMNNFPVPPQQSGILNTPPHHDKLWNEQEGDRYRSRDIPTDRSFRDDGMNRQPPWLSQNDSPSLLNNRPSARYQANTPRKIQEPARNNEASKMKSADPVLEQKAMEAEISVEFYERVAPLSMASVAEGVALEFARKDYFKGDKSQASKQSIKGRYTCDICKIGFGTQSYLNSHFTSMQHRELDDIYKLKKEQARLIMEKKMPHPKEKPNTEMIAIARAEVEMDLNPREMELDSYILGIYESVMKPYWPVPKSTYYCRTCNYLEFRSQSDHDRHKSTKEHRSMEENYDVAFCLFCQTHNKDQRNMNEHQKTEGHIRIKTLMEKTKQCAIQHWHKVNDIPYKAKPEAKPDAPKVGSKRSASPNHRHASPTKKMSVGKPESDRKADQPKTSMQKVDKDQEKNKKPDVVYMGTTKGSNSFKNDVVNSSDGKKVDVDAKDKVWYVPITGFMCIACQKFIPNESEQKAHSKESNHKNSMAKFKKMLNS